MFKILWVIELVLQAALLVRLYTLGIHRMFPLLTLWLAADEATQVVLFQLGRETYWKVWALTVPVVTVLSLLAAGEIYRRQLRELVDRNQLRWIIAGLVVGIGLAASITTTAPQWPGPDRLHGLVIATKRYAYSILFLSLGLALAFFRLFPLRADHNLAIHARIMLVYLGAYSLGYWTIEWQGRALLAPTTNVLIAVWCVCLVAWGVLFRHPEADPPAAGDSQQLEREAQDYLRVIRR